MKDKDKKIEFIFEWIKKNDGHIDTLNQYFTDAYIEKFNIPSNRIKWKNWGSNCVPELAKLLKELYYENKLNKKVVSICPSMTGYPKWVYTYFIAENKQ